MPPWEKIISMSERIPSMYSDATVLIFSISYC